MLRRAAVVLALVGSACASAPPLRPEVGALQLRAAQTRTFEIADSRLATGAVLAGLLDAGFHIDTAEAELGLVVASSERVVQKASAGKRVALALLFWPAALIPQHDVRVRVEITAVVTPVEGRTQVRLSGRAQRVSGSDVREVTPLLSAAFYQDLFARVDKALFLAREGL